MNASGSEQHNNVALVTGAARGLGKATAIALAAQGYHLLLGVRDIAASQALAAQIQASGGRAELVALDVTQADDIAAVAALIDQRFGQLDVLVNNGAIMLDGGWVGNTALTIDQQKLKATFEVNLFGTVALTQALWPLLEKAGHANIVNVSSRMGSNGLHADPEGPLAGVKPFAYDASKAALNTFTTHLAELGRPLGIQVNSAYPGWVRTEMGTEYADMSLEEGIATIVELATLPANSRTGRFEHLGETVPW